MTEIDLALGVLDHQLVDRDGRNCGKVDDLELAGVAEGRPFVVAILCGPAGWRGRGVLGRVAASLARGRSVRIPWREVARVGVDVELKKRAPELRLARGDDRAREWVERVPGSSL